MVMSHSKQQASGQLHVSTGSGNRRQPGSDCLASCYVANPVGTTPSFLSLLLLYLGDYVGGTGC